MLMMAGNQADFKEFFDWQRQIPRSPWAAG